MTMLSCVLLGSRLVVRDADPMFNEPVMLVRYWPTRFSKSDLGDDNPSAIQVCTAGFGYSLKFPGCGFWSECHLQGDSKPVHFETVPIPRPKVRAGVEARYRNGRWEKYLKTKGWVSA